MGVFAAPPCGTSSRARSIPLKISPGRFVPGPKPLRDELHPDGLVNLRWTDRCRVSSANRLYHFITEVANECIRRELVVVIENPRRSFYWLTSFFQPLADKLMFTAHQACAYGSTRPKWTVLAHNCSAFNKINKCCPGISKKHRHESWGLTTSGFATSKETAYPLQLAYEIAHAFAQEAVTRGWQPPAGTLTPPSRVQYAYLRAVVGLQPRASKLAPVLSEFSEVRHVPHTADKPPIEPGATLNEPWHGIPAGAKLLKHQPIRLNGGNSESSDSSFAFGIFRSPEAFVSEAVVKGHPTRLQNFLPTVLAEAVEKTVRCSSKSLNADRLKVLKEWVILARSLLAEDRDIHSKISPHAQRILAPKRIALWKALLVKYGYPDLGVVDELCVGTKLTGPIPPVPMFERVFKPASLTEGELKIGAKAAREAVVHSVKGSGDDFVDFEVYRKTCEERSSGWLRGPYRLDTLPQHAVVSRRFGLKQGPKVRLIDDFSGSCVNLTTQAETTPSLHTLDVVAAMLLRVVCRGRGFAWVGKTVDLSAAYRQLAVAEESLWAAYVVCFNPHSRKPEIFQMLALPFGATSSVYGFLRVAHSIWYLGCKALHLCWTSFFDDFVTIARKGEAEVLEGLVRKFFDLLGWAVSSGDKDSPFDNVFKALGVQISFSEVPSGVVSISNTKKRIDELTETITGILDKGGMSRAQAMSLRGRMQFASAQIWGRSSKLCLSAVSAHAHGDSDWVLKPQTITALKHFLISLEDPKPRRIGKESGRQWFIFTDASFQPNDSEWPCGVGGVLYDDEGNEVSAFSLGLAVAELAALGYPGKKTVIFEAELVAIIVAITLWGDVVGSCPCLIFVDNNSARDVAISGRGRSSPADALVGVLLQVEDSLSITPWIARVPSSSNPSDEPSRKGSQKFAHIQIAPDLVRECLHGILGKAAANKFG